MEIECQAYEKLKPGNSEFPDFVELNWLPLASSDGTVLFTYRIRSPNTQGLLFYFHGFNSYSLEYIELGSAMSDIGFDVFALDHRGHGRSGGVSGYFEDLNHLADDAVYYVNKVKEVYGELPVFIAGTSMGGAISINVSQRIAAKGMVLLAPALGLYEDLGCCMSGFLSCLACLCPRALIPNRRRKPLSRNTQALQEFFENEYCRFGNVRAASVKSLIEGMESTFLKAPLITTPFIVVQGGSDFVTNEAKAHRFYLNSPSRDKEYWHYPEMHHCVQIEPEYPEILLKLKQWFLNRLN